MRVNAIGKCAIRTATQRTQGLCEPISVFLWGRYERQRTLVIPIAATTIASDPAITIARFRLSVENEESARSFLHKVFLRPPPPGRLPGYPPGHPRDIPPQNFMFRFLFTF